MTGYERKEHRLLTFLCFANDLSKLSTCKRPDPGHVGAIVFDKRMTAVYAIGYNGQPVGQLNDACTGAAGACGCVHAEMNAISKLGDVKDTVMYSTLEPCALCAGLIANCRKIAVVLYRDKYRTHEGLGVLIKAGIATGCLDRWDNDAPKLIEVFNGLISNVIAR